MWKSYCGLNASSARDFTWNTLWHHKTFHRLLHSSISWLDRHIETKFGWFDFFSIKNKKYGGSAAHVHFLLIWCLNPWSSMKCALLDLNTLKPQTSKFPMCLIWMDSTLTLRRAPISNSLPTLQPPVVFEPVQVFGAWCKAQGQKEPHLAWRGDDSQAACRLHSLMLSRLPHWLRF